MKTLDARKPNQRISMVKGGQLVNGQFVPNAPTTTPVAPVPPVTPTVTAKDLANPPTVPTLTPPKEPTIPQTTLQRATNVANENQRIIEADTVEQQRRKQALEDMRALGEDPSLQSMFDQRLQDSGVNDNLSELKDIQLQLTDMNTDSGIRKTRISGAGGQTYNQAQREITQEDRENAVRTTGLAARAAVLQGNIETGRALAKDAVEIAYQDRSLKNQNLITQLNEYGKIADEQTKQLLDQAKAEAEAEIKADDEMKANIAAAIANSATQSEVAQLTAQLPPDATAEQIAQDRASKNALAQQITARGVGQMRGLDIASKNASIRSSNASAALNEAELVAYNKAQEDAAAGILTTDQAKDANAINKDFSSEPIVKEYNEMVAKQIALEQVLLNGVSGVQDTTLVYEYMKALDPNSVVREAEFEQAAKSGNIFAGTYAKFNKGYFGSGGFLPDDVKQSFIGAVKASQGAKTTQYMNVKGEYAKRINNTIGTTNGANYLTAYEGAAPLQKADLDLAAMLESATPEEINEIMQLTNSTPIQ